MVDLGPGQELLQDLSPALPVVRFRHPGVLPPNVLGIRLVLHFACSQDSEIGVEQHLGVGILTGIVRFRFPNEIGNQFAYWDGQFLAEPLGVHGTAFLVVGSLAVVDYVMEQRSQFHVVQVHPLVLSVARGSFRDKQPPTIRGSGWVVQSLEAALWAFHDATSFEEAVLKGVNLGEDADTTGAVCGQFAGAFWGESGIPASLREGLARYDMLNDALEGLMV